MTKDFVSVYRNEVKSKDKFMLGGLLTAREAEIIHHLLMERSITEYELVEPVNEGRDLPGCSYDIEIECISGTVVTVRTAYHFWFDWLDGRYTFTDWEEVEFDEIRAQELKDDIKAAQQRLGQHMPQAPEIWPNRAIEFVQIAVVKGNLTSREEFIIRTLLMRKGISRSELVIVDSGGHELIGSLWPGEITVRNGYVVTVKAIYSFRLDWVDGHYTLGEEEGYWQEMDPARSENREVIEAVQWRLDGKELE